MAEYSQLSNVEQQVLIASSKKVATAILNFQRAVSAGNRVDQDCAMRELRLQAMWLEENCEDTLSR